MKYFVTLLLNGKFNPCYEHESGINLTGLVGMGTVELTQSGLLDSSDDALSIANCVCSEKLNELKKMMISGSSWYLCDYGANDIWMRKDSKDGYTFDEEWLFSVNVLPVFDSQEEFNMCEEKRKNNTKRLRNILKGSQDTVRINYKNVVENKCSRLFETEDSHAN